MNWMNRIEANVHWRALVNIAIFNSRKCQPFPHLLIPKLRDGPHKKAVRATFGPQIADPWFILRS